MGEFFNGGISVLEKPVRDSFKLHSHEDYEIYVFIEGDADYIVEGTTYELEPYDIIVLRPGEMHRAYHKTQKKYKRIVFEVNDDFFEVNNCNEYLAVFNDREIGTRNKIPAEFVKSSGLSDIINRWFKYTNNGEEKNSAISRSVFIEILHVMNNIDDLYYEDTTNNLIASVILHINRNFTGKITLDDLENEFFVSKYHLCREFKRLTGHTIVGYINNKRLTRVKELYKMGSSINKACVEAGFSSYSSFYKAYLKEYGATPHDGLN